jgi:hypothetical protein
MIIISKNKLSKKTIMSKIDLSQAKVGDKFRTRGGCVVEYVKYENLLDLYIVSSENNKPYTVQKDGRFLCERECFSDLIMQVFDNEKDRAITDRILKDVEKVVNGVAEAMPHIESTTIANLPRDPLPDSREDETELQRRQEVFDLAEKIYIMFENEILRYHLNRDGSDRFCSEDLREMAIIRASSFINKKHKYLKDGKLC